MYKSYFLYKADSLISELTKTDIKSGNTLYGRRKLIRLWVSTIQLPTLLASPFGGPSGHTVAHPSESLSDDRKNKMFVKA